jgi:hypothetical protein
MPARGRLSSTDARCARLVFERPGSTRAELADLLGLSGASLAALVKRLSVRELIGEAGLAKSRGGRKAGQLTIAPKLAMVVAHSVSVGCVRSAIVNAWGELSSHRETHADPSGFSFVCGLEGDGVIAEVVCVPAYPTSPISSKTVFNRRGVCVPDGVRIVSGAEALLAFAGRRDSAVWDSTSLCVDLSDGATGVAREKHGGEIRLDLSPLGASDELLCAEALPDWIEDDGGQIDSSKAKVEAIAAAESQGDPEAAKICDRLAESAAEFLSKAATLFQPQQMIVAVADHVERLVDLERLRRQTRRMCSRKLNDALTLRVLETTPWTRVSGAGLAAIRNWLIELESSR